MIFLLGFFGGFPKQPCQSSFRSDSRVLEEDLTAKLLQSEGRSEEEPPYLGLFGFRV